MIGIAITLGGFLYYKNKHGGLGNLFGPGNNIVPPVVATGLPGPSVSPASIPNIEPEQAESELLAMGFEQADVDDLFEWLRDGDRTQPQAQQWMMDRAKKLGLI